MAGVSIEQDAAYWEFHVEQVPEGSSSEAMFGVATRKNSAFYKSLDEESGDGAYHRVMYLFPDSSGEMSDGIQELTSSSLFLHIHGTQQYRIATNQWNCTYAKSAYI